MGWSSQAVVTRSCANSAGTPANTLRIQLRQREAAEARVGEPDVCKPEVVPAPLVSAARLNWRRHCGEADDRLARRQGKLAAELLGRSISGRSGAGRRDDDDVGRRTADPVDDSLE